MIETNVLITLIGCAISVGAFLIGRTTAAKADGVADGELKADVKYIKSSVDKQERKLDKMTENYTDLEVEIRELKERLKALENKVKMLHGGE